MQCPNCQFENPEGHQFCGNCGNKLAQICPQCQFSNPPNFSFCGQCGNALSMLEKPAPLEFSRPQTYTPQHLVDKIFKSRKSIVGERKRVTVLFADAVNYTAMSEKLDPEDVHRIMDECYRILIDQVHRYEGTINQFTGDGIMALFGAPLSHEDHAQRGALAALAIQDAIAGYAEKLSQNHGIDFNMRIGLNSGLVIVGAIGDDLQMDYTALGDTVNLASRMESMASPGKVLVSENTHRLIEEYFELEYLGKLAVKGKAEPQKTWRLIKAGPVGTRIGASVAKGLTRFVGRKNSMYTLMQAFNKVISRQGQVVAVVGEAGVGKSRLMLEFRQQLVNKELVFWEGHCLPFGSTISYLPITEIVRTCFKIKEGDSESIIKKSIEDKVHQIDPSLHAILAPIYDLLSLNAKDSAYRQLEPKQKREKIFESIRDLLIYESQTRPIVLLVDDLHWIDDTSQAFLDYLIGMLANTRIMLILLYRPEYTHPWGSKSYYHRIGLDQLTLESSTELICSILPTGQPDPELKTLIIERAAGNPLFMEEFTHTLLENGSIQCKGPTCELVNSVDEIRVPDTIEGIIAARMDRLESDVKGTMQVAAVIG